MTGEPYRTLSGEPQAVAPGCGCCPEEIPCVFGGAPDIRTLCTFPANVGISLAGIPDAPGHTGCRSEVNGDWTLPKTINDAEEVGYEFNTNFPPDIGEDNVGLGVAFFCSSGVVVIEVSIVEGVLSGVPCPYSQAKYLAPMLGCGPWTAVAAPGLSTPGVFDTYPNSVTVNPIP